MTEQHYISDELVCEYLIDIRALTSLVVDIGNLQRVSAVPTENTIVYRYSSTDREYINQLHMLWIHYLQTGNY